ncbi:hypothetical protein HPCPY3281_1291 [Helicobacter pylori CPY3281]|nr:hypothetical protein HPCPY3281_1291 [Helicobacter pylori CPY3281]
MLQVLLNFFFFGLKKTFLRVFNPFYLSNYLFCYKIDSWLYCQTGITKIFNF